MRPRKINIKQLLRLIDSEGMPAAQAAKKLGVSRQAVSRLLIDLRGKTTRAVVVKQTAEVVERKIDTLKQLSEINGHANWLLDHVMKWIKGDPEAIQVLESHARQVNVGNKKEPEWVTEYKFKDPHEIALRAMAEVRAQLDLQLQIYQTMYSIQESEKFQQTVLEVLGEVDGEIRDEIIRRLNERKSIRSAMRFS